jgi:uncharacterized protein YjfI (DUF2170 family)
VLEEVENVLQVVVENREEFPVFVQLDDDQILCTSYLFDHAHIKDGQLEAMQAAMLAMNVPMPLSAFGLIRDRYVIFGALARHASFEDLMHEIEVLSDNSLEAVEAMIDYLKQEKTA